MGWNEGAWTVGSKPHLLSVMFRGHSEGCTTTIGSGLPRTEKATMLVENKTPSRSPTTRASNRSRPGKHETRDAQQERYNTCMCTKFLRRSRSSQSAMASFSCPRREALNLSPKFSASPSTATLLALTRFTSTSRISSGRSYSSGLGRVKVVVSWTTRFQ